MQLPITVTVGFARTGGRASMKRVGTHVDALLDILANTVSEVQCTVQARSKNSTRAGNAIDFWRSTIRGTTVDRDATTCTINLTWLLSKMKEKTAPLPVIWDQQDSAKTAFSTQADSVLIPRTAGHTSSGNRIQQQFQWTTLDGPPVNQTAIEALKPVSHWQTCVIGIGRGTIVNALTSTSSFVSCVSSRVLAPRCLIVYNNWGRFNGMMFVAGELTRTYC